MKKSIIILTTGILLFLANSCMKDDVIIDTDRISKFDRPLNLAAPIGTIEVSASDLLGRLSDSVKSHILIGEDGLLNAKYTDSINLEWDAIVKIEDVQLQENYPIIIPPGITDLSQSITFNKKIQLNEKSDQRFDSMYIESSQMILDVEVPNDLSGDIMVSFPEIEKDGQVLSITFEKSSSSRHDERSLEGYRVIFSHGVDSSYITMQITLNNISSQNNLGGNYDIGINLTLSETVPEIIFGSFGSEKVIDDHETLNFSIFNDLNILDMIQFKDILLDINFESFYGIDYEAVIDNAVVISSSKNDSLELIMTDNSTFFVNAATYNDSIIPTFNTKHFDETNSNIADAITLLPDKLDYDVVVTTNPVNSAALNFVTGDNKISGQINILVPLWLKCTEYARTDTMYDINFNDMIEDETLDLLDSVVLTFDIENGLPFDIDFQAYFLDDSDTPIDSLFQNPQKFLVSGTLNSNDIINEPGKSSLDIVLSKIKIEKFKEFNVTKVLIASKTVTAENGSKFVKILDSYGLEFKLSIEIVSDEL